MVELKDVSKYYNSNGVVTVALEHINLMLNKNEIVAITGESGSGKSTLLNIITGMDNYDEGEIYYKGNETSYFNNDDMDNFRKKHVGFIFQNYNIIDSYTVLQNVMLPLLINGKTKKEAKTKALELIERVGLKDRIKNRGSKLSGGEKQRVVIARALASDCDILACDEPTGNLDSKTSKEIIDLIKSVAKDKLVLIVTHNYAELKDIATRKIVVSDGHIITDEINKEASADENFKLDLDSKPIKKKALGILTFFNIFSTPRKTILISLIFMAVALILYTMPQAIYYNLSSSNNTYGNRDYPINYDGYVIAYDNDGIARDKLAELDGNVKENPFNEYVTYKLSHNDFEVNVNYVPFDFPYELEEGKKPNKSNDAILIYPYNHFIDDAFLGTSTLTNRFNETMNLNITGLAYSKYATRPVLKANNLDDFLNKGLLASMINCSFNDLNIEVYLNPSVSKAKLKYPNKYLKNDLAIETKIGDLYSLNLEIEYEKTDADEFSLELNPNYIASLALPVYEVRLVTNNLNSLTKSLDRLDISYIHPASIAPKDINTRLMIFINIVLLIFPTLIIYIMTYFILSRIYLSKTKEYTIMRTMGICKPDMFKMVELEATSLALINSLIIYLLTIILGFSISHRAFSMYRLVNPFITILFFVVMLLFSFFLARRFNKKLFSKTGAGMLKEEE